jgi:MFS family permease
LAARKPAQSTPLPAIISRHDGMMRQPFSQWRLGNPVRRGLYFAMIEGGVVGGMIVAMEAWMVPLLQTSLGAAAFVVGLLTLIPQMGMIGLSPFTRQMIERMGGAKRAAILACWWQVTLIALLAIPLHQPDAPWAIPVAVCLVCAFGLTGVFGGPAWVAWISGFVPRQISGRYQARRMRLFNLAKLVFAGLFACIAHYVPLSSSAWGLQLILGIAIISRLGSIWCLERQPYVVPRTSPAPLSRRSAEAATGIIGFLSCITRTDIGRWTLVWATFQGGVMVAGPFFASYMIATPDSGGLGLEPFAYSLLLYTSVVARILFYPVVGRMVDLFGPRAVLRIAFLAIFILPVAWAMTGQLGVLLVNEVLAGAAWAAAEIAIGALMFASHPDPVRRAELIGYFNTVSAACIALGTLLGTLLVDLVPPIAGSRYHTIFIISIALRIPGLVLALRWLPSLRQIDPVESHHLVQALPGVELVSSFGRGLAGLFRRPFD